MSDDNFNATPPVVDREVRRDLLNVYNPDFQYKAKTFFIKADGGCKGNLLPGAFPTTNIYNGVDGAELQDWWVPVYKSKPRSGQATPLMHVMDRFCKKDFDLWDRKQQIRSARYAPISEEEFFDDVPDISLIGCEDVFCDCLQCGHTEGWDQVSDIDPVCLVCGRKYTVSDFGVQWDSALGLAIAFHLGQVDGQGNYE